MTSWALVGAGALLAWGALPVLARAASTRHASEPRCSHERLVLVLLSATALFVVPALGSALPRALMVHAPVQLAFHVLASAQSHAAAMRPSFAGTVAVSPFALAGVIWAALAGWAALRALVQGLRLWRLLCRAEPASPELYAHFARALDASWASPPKLVVSHEITAPFVFGPRAPVIVFPSVLTSALDATQHELVLRHELAHVRRGDLRSSLLVQACATLFAGHPAAARLVREIQLAREAAVDAEVAREDPHAYATLLVEVASLGRRGKTLAAVSMDDTALTRRIEMLIDHTPERRRPSSRAVMIAATIAAGIGLAAPAVFAESGSGKFGRDHGEGPPFPAQENDINGCFDEARKENPSLVVDTRAEIEASGDGKVTSAHVPTPESPTFQRCIEQKAMSWQFPPPPDAPYQPPPDAKLHVMFPIHLPKT